MTGYFHTLCCQVYITGVRLPFERKGGEYKKRPCLKPLPLLGLRDINPLTELPDRTPCNPLTEPPDKMGSFASGKGTAMKPLQRLFKRLKRLITSTISLPTNLHRYGCFLLLTKGN